jgi:hypothetical protein
MYVHVFLIHTVDTVYLLEGTVYAFNTLMCIICVQQQHTIRSVIIYLLNPNSNAHFIHAFQLPTILQYLEVPVPFQ